METATHPPATSARERLPLTAFLWVLVGYFCIDAAMRGATVASMVAAAPETTRALLLHCVLQALFGVLELLITLQIFVRTIAARVFGTGLLFMHLLWSTYSMALKNPDAWLMLDVDGRLRFIGHILFLAVAIVLLNRRPCRQVLSY